jgi:PAS domain S-box-containing protein
MNLTMNHERLLPLRVLLVEDQVTDAELLLLALRQAGYAPEAIRVQTEESFLAEIESEPDLILADYSLPQFDAPRALELLRRRDRDIPVIVVTGAVSEEVVVACMQQGASDYLFKDKLGRLGPAVERALAEKLHRDEQRQLREVQLRLAAIVQSSTDAIISTAADGKISSWNPAAEQLYGYNVSEAVGQPFTMLMPETERATLPLLLARLHDENLVAHEEAQRIRKDGSFLMVSRAVSPIRSPAGEMTGAAIIESDITAKKATERAREEFLSSMSHDLKTPLVSIQGLTELVQQQLLRQGTSDAMRMATRLAGVVNSTRKMTDLINQMLDVTRVQMGQLLELERRPTDLITLVKLAIDLQQVASPSHHIELDSPAEPLIASVDDARFERVVANLLSNSVKYSPGGGVVRVKVWSEGQGSAPWAVISVSDRGIGIPEADLPHVFTSFFRGSNVSGKIPGSGIGLASARQIVEQHGGYISAAGSPGNGATFTARIPLAV